jgi:hypothetical protein
MEPAELKPLFVAWPGAENFRNRGWPGRKRKKMAGPACASPAEKVQQRRVLRADVNCVIGVELGGRARLWRLLDVINGVAHQLL